MTDGKTCGECKAYDLLTQQGNTECWGRPGPCDGAMKACDEFAESGVCRDCAYWRRPHDKYGMFCHIAHGKREEHQRGCQHFTQHEVCDTCGWMWYKTGECKDPRIIERLGLDGQKPKGATLVYPDSRACPHHATVEGVQQIQEERITFLKRQLDGAREHLRNMPYMDNHGHLYTLSNVGTKAMRDREQKAKE